MNKKILSYINKCEKWKVEIKELHWGAKNLSQHKLCDDIASAISDFEDLVSEVEQSMSGKIKKGELKPDKATVVDLKTFVENVISESQSFLKELDGMGEAYIAIKSECESFIGVMQRNLYLVNFTLKEGLRNRLKQKISESRPKNIATVDKIEQFLGKTPTNIKTRISHIYKLVNDIYGIDKKRYHDEAWEAITFYHKALESFKWIDNVDIYPCANLNKPDWDIQSDGGYCDYDPNDNMPRSKQYKVVITCFDGMKIEGYIKCMACGTVEDPFSAYDTCMILWPKTKSVVENKEMKNQIRLSEEQLKQLVKDAAIQVIKEKIEIDPKNKGKFTKTQRETGKSASELKNSKNPLTRKRANFALMAKRHWKPLKEEDYGLRNEFYSEEDYNGNVGEEGMVKSYDIGAYYVGQAEQDAQESGFNDVAEYLQYWFEEIQPDCPWYWQKVGSGYGYNGDTIFKNGGIVCKDIFGQIMIDEYPIGGI